MTTERQVDKAEALRRSPLFELLSPAEIEVLAGLVTPRRFAPGDVVLSEGDLGESVFVIAEGQVEVSRHEHRQAPLAVFGPPAAFGEMALVDREQRSATVRARSAVTALELSAAAFSTFRTYSRDGFTLVVMNIARVLSGRLRETSAKLAVRL
jgi:CRP-like cAMP-binding protein